MADRVVHATSADGTQIGCHVSGDGPALVLVHGTAADHSRWAGVIPALADRFTIYAIDRRGRGASGDAGDYAIESEFDDLAAVVDAIGGDVDVLGHSYGAVCALAAATRTSNLRRLVLYEPPLPVGIEVYPAGLTERLNALLAADDRDGVVSTFMQEVVRMPPAQLEALRSDPSWEARLAAAHTIPRELRLVDGEGFERFAAVDAPTLLLVGGDSPPFLVEASRRLEQALPDARLETMPGQQHVAMNTAPELFLGLVLDFLS
jgi:pimeloyl-ACP methyl ester carboxylesterase